MLANYHTHTWRCNHASGTEEEYVQNAIARGMHTLGFSDHSPFPLKENEPGHIRIPVNQLPDYVNAVRSVGEKYADKIRENYSLPESVSPHTFRRTRGTMLYRDGVPLEAIAIKLGHSHTKTTRDHYTSPSNDQMREIAGKRNKAIPEAEPLWPDDEEEMSRILGF